MYRTYCSLFPFLPRQVGGELWTPHCRGKGCRIVGEKAGISDLGPWDSHRSVTSVTSVVLYLMLKPPKSEKSKKIKI